ncbi:MAG TPA: flagellar basal body L-ring protein FlgH [Candidatus Binatia bacterium]|nr:flagellar basal body L-ring protein FlgH [Candidatus Binatia bacterium]
MNKTIALAFVFVLALASLANADTLYVSPPVSVAPGHPLRLGSDHRATQVGDIVNVVFNYSATNTLSDTTSISKNASIGAGKGAGSTSGISLFNTVTIPTTLNAQTGANTTKTHAITVSFQSAMMATVIDVLPSGTMAIAGDQQFIMNGSKQTVHITGIVRQEDIDFTDSIPSNRIANAQARYDGNVPANNQGVLQKIVNFLF